MSPIKQKKLLLKLKFSLEVKQGPSNEIFDPGQTKYVCIYYTLTKLILKNNFRRGNLKLGLPKAQNGCS